MANLSQQKRQRMLEFLQTIREEHKDDDDVLIAIGEIESELNAKKYGLVWEQHEEAVDIQMRDNIPVFTECTDKEINVSADGVYNFILEGDNLHSLRLLEKTHAGRVDVIYIDPPYNTGNSFRYNDTIVGDEDSFKHSKWLSFMNERLRLASTLLTEKGIIFISINDYEGAPLKLLCDDVFGEKNFVGQLTWESTTQPTNAGSARFSLQKKVESIYCYAKNKSARTGFILREIESDLKYPHLGKHGACRFEIIEKSDAGAYRRDSMKFQILGQYPREGKRWQIGEDTARALEAAGKVEIVDGMVKKAVYPEDELDKRKFEPFWSHLKAENVGTAQNGKDELNTIIGKPVGFDTVKPTRLIKELLSHFPNDSLILDFFAGSGTTGQAVMEMNKEDGGSRQFILCTNNENNICEEVTYERIRHVINGYKDTAPVASNLKYYRTDFVSKDAEDVSEELLAHITEMVQLEHGVKIDGSEYLIIMNDDELDALEQNWDNCGNVKAMYVSKNVLFTTVQKKLFGNIEIHIIPDNYFQFELKEVGEAW